MLFNTQKLKIFTTITVSPVQPVVNTHLKTNSMFLPFLRTPEMLNHVLWAGRVVDSPPRVPLTLVWCTECSHRWRWRTDARPSEDWMPQYRTWSSEDCRLQRVAWRQESRRSAGASQGCPLGLCGRSATPGTRPPSGTLCQGSRRPSEPQVDRVLASLGSGGCCDGGSLNNSARVKRMNIFNML